MDVDYAAPRAVGPPARKRKWSPSGSEQGNRAVTEEFMYPNGQDLQTTPKSVGGDMDENNIKRARLLDESSNNGSLPKGSTAKPQQSMNVSNLPPELLQHVFSFLDPVSLGRLTRVSTSFNALLDPRKPLPPRSDKVKGLPFQSQDNVWSTSRKRYHPGFPRPLSSLSELEMWRLICGTRCQICGKQPPGSVPMVTPSPWNAGPGPDSVRIIWPFGVRSCGACLSSRLVKESELLFSASSALLPALPYGFLSASLNLITSYTLRHTSPPPDMQLTKYFFRPQVEELKKKLQEVLTLGVAAAEEWYKGLEHAGQEKVNDAARFEQWEAAGGLQALFVAQRKAPSAGLSTPDSLLAATKIPQQLLQQNSSGSRVHSPIHPNFGNAASGVSSPAPGIFPNLPMKPILPAPGQYQNYSFQPNVPAGLPTHPHGLEARLAQPKPERNLRDVNQMKLDRRAEIERRCILLDPPILPATLMHMDAFAAAIQIPRVFDDKAWELLKPRLLSQRKDAEAKEGQQRTASLHQQVKAEERRQQEDQLKIAKENLEREWDDMQKPAREKISKYADELIQTHWHDGAGLTRDNAAQFAADVLQYVRKRFFEVLAHEDLVLSSQGLPPRHDSPNGASTRRLTLEHMKWVNETKIKPLTEHLRKELYLCSACDWNNNRYNALDRVIQHYAAKHTSALSHGTAVVYWKADWPEEPPFDPNPGAKGLTRSEFSANETSPQWSESGMTSIEKQLANFEHASYQGSDRAFSQVPFSPLLPGKSSLHASFYATSVQPKSPVPTSDGMGRLSYNLGLPQTYRGSAKTFEPLPNQSLPGFSPRIPPYAQPSRPFPGQFQDQVPRPGSVIVNASQLGPPPSHISHLTPSTYSQILTSGWLPAGAPGQPGGIYHVQIEELARNAREVWDGTEDIAGLPSSVRIQVIIHHVVLRFSEKYTNEPKVALFTDALNNSSRMRPLQDLGDLTCKACATAVVTADPSLAFKLSAVKVGKNYMLPDLLKHFQSVHIDNGRARTGSLGGMELSQLDWKFDMIQLPPESIVRDLLRAPGMTNSKLSLIATVLPSYFPFPLPKLDTVPTNLPGAQGSDLTRMDESSWNIRHGPSHAELSEHQVIVGAATGAYGRHEFRDVDPPQREEPPITEPAGEDEYDPHRPAPAYGIARRHENNNHLLLHPQPEPRFARRLIYSGSPPDEYLADHSFSVPNRRPEVLYRYREYPVHEPVIPVQEYYVRERRDHMIYQPHPSRPTYQPQVMDDRDGGYSSRRSLNLGEEDDLVQPLGELVKQEHTPDTQTDSMNAAEHFLNNFENIAVDSYPDNEPALLPSAIDDPEHPLRDQPAHGHALDDSETRGAESDRPRTGIGSRRTTPRDLLTPNGRGRSRTPLRGLSHRVNPDSTFDHDVSEINLYEPRPREDLRSREAGFAGNYSSQGRTKVIEYDQNGLPLPTAHIVARPSVEPTYYDERSPPTRYQPRHVLAQESPELYRARLSEGQLRYKVLPSSQYRYVEDRRSIDAGYEQVEYVRLAPREAQAPGRYYIERPTREYHPEYVEYDSQHGGGLVYERDGQLYTRAPPPSDPRSDPYHPTARY